MTPQALPRPCLPRPPLPARSPSARWSLALALASAAALTFVAPGCFLLFDDGDEPPRSIPWTDTTWQRRRGFDTDTDGAGGEITDVSWSTPDSATSAVPNRNPNRFPGITGQLVIGNLTGQARVVRVQMLLPTIEMDCDAVAAAPSQALRTEHFADAQAWLLEPGRAFAIASPRACAAALVGASGVAETRMLFWRASQWPQRSLPSVAQAVATGPQASTLLAIDAVEGQAVFSDHAAGFDAPVDVDPPAPEGCKLPLAEADLVFADLPGGDHTLVEVLQAPDGCALLRLFGDDGVVDRYLCAPPGAIPFAGGDDVFVAKLATGHNVLPLDGVELVGNAGQLRLGRGDDIVYFGPGAATIGTTSCPPQHDAAGTWARALQLEVALPSGKIKVGPGQSLALGATGGASSTLYVVHAEERLLWDSAKAVKLPGKRWIESVWSKKEAP